MVFEKLPLALTESPNIDRLVRLDSHALQGLGVRYRGDDQSAGVLEADKASIKEMIDTWSEQLQKEPPLGFGFRAPMD